MPDLLPIPNSGIVAYGRLSRADEQDKSTPLEEKVALRKAILVTLARHALDVELHEEDITFEMKSGGSLTERPGLLEILERCRRGELHTLVIHDIDRLTRDIGDWRTVESALFKGKIRLVTSRGEYHFTPAFDPTLLQILAVLGEKERRSFSYRRKATNVQRTKQGQPSQGFPPYGYRWEKETKRYRIEPTEYAIICEIFQRSRHEGCLRICKDLNRRGIVAPGVGKRNDANLKWLRGTVANLIRNPFYAGRLVKRKDVDREGETIVLPHAQWVWSESEEIRYPVPPDPENPNAPPQWEVLPHPVSLEEWYTLQDTMTERAPGKPVSRGLLTGLLHCGQGAPMYMHTPQYHCCCKDYGTPHWGYTIKKALLERLVLACVAEALDRLPETALKPTRAKRNQATLAADVERELAASKRQLREKRETMLDLVNRAGFYHSLPGFGKAGHTTALETVGKEIEALEAKLTGLEAKRSQSQQGIAAPILARLRECGGAMRFFADAPHEAQREMLRYVVRRIDLEPIAAGRGHTRAVTVTMYPLLPGEGESVTRVEIQRHRAGTKRGPYKRRPKQDEESQRV